MYWNDNKSWYLLPGHFCKIAPLDLTIIHPDLLFFIEFITGF